MTPAPATRRARMPRLLDLFCGAGGAAMGYHRAGFEVIGVDINPQPHYPFEFHQGDALEYLVDHGHEFDIIHASPPCQRYMGLQNVNRARGLAHNHPDLIPETRRLLTETGKPWVIENVQGAPLFTGIVLCGYSMGLPGIARHRHFESSMILFGQPCSHQGKPVVGIYGDYPDGHRITTRKYKITYAVSSIDEARKLMGIDWMDWDEIREAIPPAYTEYIGRQLINAVLI